MSYEARIVKMDGTGLKVHFSNGTVDKFNTLREYKEFLRFYGKKTLENKSEKEEKKNKRRKE